MSLDLAPGKGGCELPYTRIKLTDREANINFGKHGASFWEAGFLITTIGWLTDTWANVPARVTTYVIKIRSLTDSYAGLRFK